MLTPKRMRRFHAVLTVIWFFMMPVSLYFGWVTSVIFVSVLSVYALFAAHFASWQSTRTEERQEAADNARDDEIVQRIESKLAEISARLDQLQAPMV